jgi:hypothetical protein
MQIPPVLRVSVAGARHGMSGAVRRGGHLIIEPLLLAAPTREMDDDVGGYLDRLRQDLHDLAI